MTNNFWSPVVLSFEIATCSLIIVFLTGVILAKKLNRKKFKGKLLIETIFMLPLVLPPTVVGFLLIIIFGKSSPVGQLIEELFHQPVMFTWVAALIASTVVAFPLMYQSAKAGLLSVNPAIEEAARVDGANEWKVYYFVSLPLASKALISGAILSFARALGEFGATLMFAGNLPGKTQTIPTAIYIAMESGNMNMAWLWVLIVIGFSFLMLLAANFIK